MNAVELALDRISERTDGRSIFHPLAWRDLMRGSTSSSSVNNSGDSAGATTTADAPRLAIKPDASPLADVAVTAKSRTGPAGWTAMPFSVLSPDQVPAAPQTLRSRTRQGTDKSSSGGDSPSSPSSEELQAVIDKAANFTLAVVPHENARDHTIAHPHEPGAMGFQITARLRRFVIGTKSSSGSPSLTASNVTGEEIGEFRSQCLPMPWDFAPKPGGHPPPLAAFSEDRVQRFLMAEDIFVFDEQNGFTGFGTGQTEPVTIEGRRQWRLNSVGAIRNGAGKFKGCEESVYTFCGLLDPERGFSGTLTLRIIDRELAFRPASPLSAIRAGERKEPGITWLAMRTQGMPSDPVTILNEVGMPGLQISQRLQLFEADCSRDSQAGLAAFTKTSELRGTLLTRMAFDPGRATGTLADPVPYTSYLEFNFFDSSGKAVGGFAAESSEGRLFHTTLLGFPAIRCGGIGQIRTGWGSFSGISGWIADNSIAVLDPGHRAGTTHYVLRVEDPRGKYVSKVKGARSEAVVTALESRRSADALRKLARNF